jgi:hypothetical protein
MSLKELVSLISSLQNNTAHHDEQENNIIYTCNIAQKANYIFKNITVYIDRSGFDLSPWITEFMKNQCDHTYTLKTTREKQKIE